MHEAIAILRHASEGDDPADVFAVTQRAIASALKVIMRADDSSGIIGDACRDLLELHPVVAAEARTAASKLVDWTVSFQFDNECDYFTIDPVAYAPALGTAGMAAYRVKLDERAAVLGPRPPDDRRWSSPHSGAWLTLDWNAQRLAVFDRDVDAIIRTHARDRRVAAWLQDTATALAEIGEVDAAIDWAKQANPYDDAISMDTFVDWLVEAGYPIARVPEYAAWLERFETSLRSLPEKQRAASLLPLLHNYQQPQPPIIGSLAPADHFRAAVQDAKIGPDKDIPHLSQPVIVKYADDLELLGLL